MTFINYLCDSFRNSFKRLSIDYLESQKQKIDIYAERLKESTSLNDNDKAEFILQYEEYCKKYDSYMLRLTDDENLTKDI